MRWVSLLLTYRKDPDDSMVARVRFEIPFRAPTITPIIRFAGLHHQTIIRRHWLRFRKPEVIVILALRRRRAIDQDFDQDCAATRGDRRRLRL